MLVKWQNPARNLFNLNDFDHVFDELIHNRTLERSDVDIHPRINVEENENDWIISAELPGVAKKDVQINFQDNVLSISGEKKFEKEDKQKNFHRVERSFGKFSRSFNINSPVIVDKIEAEFKDGVLVVTLPKAEEAKPKQININVK
jgi:HSP20 family protein